MEREPVSSSSIASVGWENGVLEVEFVGRGGVYHYSGVSEETFTALKTSTSAGKFFQANIRGAYPTTKVA